MPGSHWHDKLLRRRCSWTFSHHSPMKTRELGGMQTAPIASSEYAANAENQSLKIVAETIRLMNIRTGPFSRNREGEKATSNSLGREKLPQKRISPSGSKTPCPSLQDPITSESFDFKSAYPTGKKFQPENHFNFEKNFPIHKPRYFLGRT